VIQRSACQRKRNVARLIHRTCSPLRLPASQLKQLPVLPPPVDRDRGQVRVEEATCRGGTDPRIASLERNIQFLQQQHKDTLGKLHTEIEYLRRENKGEEMEVMLNIIRAMGLILKLSETLGSSRHDHGPELKGGLITSLQPLRIHSSPSHPPRAPTLQECEVIIRQLYNANSLQSQEVSAFQMTAFSLPYDFLPRSGPSQSGVILPALKQTFSTNIAERQRRTRAVQRNRFKRTVH
uniref:Si:ch211-222n4.2 n=1 Tax=Sphaeramia orbicularis TaxID=375764 RepID=A0A672ZFG4_9TELE